MCHWLHQMLIDSTGTITYIPFYYVVHIQTNRIQSPICLQSGRPSNFKIKMSHVLWLDKGLMISLCFMILNDDIVDSLVYRDEVPQVIRKHRFLSMVEIFLIKFFFHYVYYHEANKQPNWWLVMVRLKLPRRILVSSRLICLLSPYTGRFGSLFL